MAPEGRGRPRPHQLPRRRVRPGRPAAARHVLEQGLGARLLASLDERSRDALAPRLSQREFGFRDTVYRQDGDVSHVVFPLHGVFSLISDMKDGRGAEVATVGNEGLVGLPGFLQPALPTAHRAIAQIPGDGLVLPAAALVDAADEIPALHLALHGYTLALITQIAQGSVCNRLHSVEQRCVRWLLQTHDRVRADEFVLVQEFLGQMLGVGRQTVNETARTLQQQGLIRYVRGMMTIVDRPRLEAAACECYFVIRHQFDRLMRPTESGTS